MNGHVKFHNADGPAFQAGERWVDSSDTLYEITGRRRWGQDTWDVDVTYCRVGHPEQQWTKDAWNFQVRCTHVADSVV